MPEDEEYVIDWDRLPRDEDGRPYVDLGDERYFLPYVELIPQNVSATSLRKSIEADGIEYPIIVDEDNKVIDGMTRMYIAHDLDLSADEVPIKREDVASEEDGWEKAIELNAVRRQLSGSMRRELIEKIVERKGWRKPSIHVTDLAELLGVHKSTISRDIDRIYNDEEVQELKERKQTLNISLTGMRNAGRMIDSDTILADLPEDEQEHYRSTLDELVDLLEQERAELTEELAVLEDK